jgi:hypothetical protein
LAPPPEQTIGDDTSIDSDDNPGFSPFEIVSESPDVVAYAIANVYKTYLLFQPTSGSAYALGYASWHFAARVDRQPDNSFALTLPSVGIEQGVASAEYPSARPKIGMWTVVKTTTSPTMADMWQQRFNRIFQ